MQISVDTRQLSQLEADLNQVGRSLDRRTVGPALLNAAKPMLVALKQETPVGRVPSYKSGAVVRGPRKGSVRQNSGTYARGGALRASDRLWSVEGKGDEVTRLIVGVSKQRGKVGWRAFFTVKGTKHNRANNFVQRAYDRTIDLVKLRFMSSLTQTVQKILVRATK